MKLLIIGAGGYGRLVKELAELNGYDTIDFLDDNSSLAIGKISELERVEGDYDGSIVAIGDMFIRESIYRRLKRPVSLVHPKAAVSKTALLGKGCVIEANATVNSESVIGDGVFICAGAVVNHNAVVSDFCQIDCNAVVSRGRTVLPKVMVGSCTVV